MEKLINEKVTHTKFGNGVIKEVNDEYLSIKFDILNDNKKFKYPDSFDEFIIFENNELQKITSQLLNKEKYKKMAKEDLIIQKYAKISAEKKNGRIEKLKKQKKLAIAKVDRERAVKSNLKLSINSNNNSEEESTEV